ncbi:hypothetical protein [Nonomuraea sp. NPDC023979]|uniref:hypothetical protein n=1 Tax=Nonomuraea sp. NPDC023979 TaxID=3154796 RepID=UPI0033DE9D3A
MLKLLFALLYQRFHFLRKDAGLQLRIERPVADLSDGIVADGLASRRGQRRL